MRRQELWANGYPNTQGVGIHPNDGALQPKGALAYPWPLFTHRGRGRVDPKGMVSISSDGYFQTRGPYLQHLRVFDLEPEISQPRTLQGAKDGRHGGRMARARLTPTKNTALA